MAVGVSGEYFYKTAAFGWRLKTIAAMKVDRR
jgi:hypothetical protein